VLHENGVVDAILFISILLPAVILHEVAHGWVAERLGDPTARDAGRITLNPISHIDPFGSVLLPGMLALAGANVFGWAKPVPVNPMRLSRPTEGMAIVALAGPATNLTLAMIVGRLGPFVEVNNTVFLTTGAIWARLAFGFLLVNAALAVFNMLPIPPLDGSRLLPLVLSDRGRLAYAKVSQYGFIILFLLLFVFEEALAFLGDWIGWIVRMAV